MSNSHVGSVAHLFGLLAIRPPRFYCCQTKVSDFHSKVVIVKKYIVGFQVPIRRSNAYLVILNLLCSHIPVNNVFGMQVIHSLTGLSGDFYHI